jgi:transposase
VPGSKPPYPAEVRQQIVELVRVGRTPIELAAQFGCSAQTIRNCVAQDAIDEGKPLPGKEGLSTAEREELVRLRRQLKLVEQERDILVKATAWFAARHDKTSSGSSNS